MEYFRKFWANEKHGKHLYKTEDFFLKEAKEQLHHLDGGESLIDFGCGSAEALVYYAKEYKTVIGVDFSSSMLAEAQKRLEEKNISNVKLLHADDKTIWNMLDGSYDRIMAYGVVQYLTYDEIDNFICQASKKINKRGKIILFVVLDPYRWYLRRIGALNKNSEFSFFGAFREIIYIFAKSVFAFFKRVPPDNIGFAYSPKTIEEIAARYKLKMEYALSIYYPDRYHAILTLE